MEENTLLTNALGYLGKGLSVIPIGKDKKPFLERWLMYQNRLPTEQEIKQWWTQWPDANIGIVTGKLSGITVVDIERGGKTEDMPPTRIAKSGGGGWHYYYKYQEGIGNKARIRELTDIRGDGGYIIAPPSVHGSGNRYAWVLEDDMTEFPTALFHIVSRKEYTPLRASDYVGIPDGSRNDKLHRLACSFLNSMPEYEAWETVQEFNQTAKPPIGEDELKSVFDKARRFIAANPKNNRGTYTIRGDVRSSDNGLPEQDGDRVISDPYKPVDICDLSIDQKEIEWIWKGFLAKNHVTLFSALWKVGKSTFISHLLKTLESGGQFPKPIREGETCFTASKSKVLVLSEESDNIWAERRDELGIENREWLYVVCRPLKQRLNYRGWVELLERMGNFCKEKEIELFIIDTISGFWNVENENDAAQVTAALTAVNNVLGKNTAVLLVHHFRKSGGDEAVAARGSGVLGSYVDIIIEFTRMKGDVQSSQRVMKMYTRFSETPSEMVIELKEDEYWLNSMNISDVIRTKKMDNVENIIRQMPEGGTVSEVLDIWNTQNKPITARAMRRYVSSLAAQGRIKSTSDKIVGKKKTPIWSVLPVNPQKPAFVPFGF